MSKHAAVQKRSMANRGQGRKKGVPSKKTQMLRQLAEEAIASGVPPIEVLLNKMRKYYAESEAILDLVIEGAGKKQPAELLELVKELKGLERLAGYYAVEAAPYCHAKLSNITLDGNINHKVQEADDAFKIIEGTLGEVIPPTEAGAFSKGSLVEGGPTKSDYTPEQHQPTDLDRKLERLAAAGGTRVRENAGGS